MTFVVFVSDHKAHLESHIFTENSIVVGGASNCDLVLHDSAISAQHCRIEHDGDHFLITDLSSPDGILFNGHQTSTSYQANDERYVQVEDSTLMLRILSPEEQGRHHHGETLALEIPAQLLKINAEKDLKIRMGLTSPKKTHEPSSLNSIYKSVLTDEKERGSASKPSSLNSIFHEVTPNQQQLSSLNSIYEVVSPLPTQQVALNENGPTSLNSIFNEVSPLSEEELGHSALGALDSAHEQVFQPSPNQVRLPSSLNSVFHAINPLADYDLKPLTSIFKGHIDHLLSDESVAMINLNGFDTMMYRLKGERVEQSTSSPFRDLSQAQEASKAILTALGLAGRQVGEGLLKEGQHQFWVYISLEIAYGPCINLERLPDLSQSSPLNLSSLKTLSSIIHSGGKMALMGESRHDQMVVLSQVLREMFSDQRVISVGLRSDWGHHKSWLTLGSDEVSLGQALSLSPTVLIIGDHSSLSGRALAEALHRVPSSVLLFNAKSLEKGIQELLKKIGDHELMNQAVSHLAMIEQGVESKINLMSIYTYPELKEIFSLL